MLKPRTLGFLQAFFGTLAVTMALTNLQKCVTTSQQTDLSHFHRENDSQVYLPAIKQTQTMRESGTQHARSVQYVGGLRGNDFTTGAPANP